MNKLSPADMMTLYLSIYLLQQVLQYFVHHCMLILKLKNSKLKLSCTGPGPTNTRDKVVVTGEYLGCIRSQVTLDSSHHINHHAHYSVSFTVPTASISSRELELRCHVSQVSGQWRMLTIGRNNTDPESIKRDTTNTHWPLDITIIHSLAILRQIG